MICASPSSSAAPALVARRASSQSGSRVLRPRARPRSTSSSTLRISSCRCSTNPSLRRSASIRSRTQDLGSCDREVRRVRVRHARVNHSTSGALKNAIDFLFAEWNDKAAGFVSYGSSNGVRAVEHLRQISAEVRMADVRTAVGLSLFDDFEHFTTFKPRDVHQTTIKSCSTRSNAGRRRCAASGRERPHFIECNPNMLPSVSSASAMKPYSPIENLPRWIFPPAGTTRCASTAQSSQAK